MALPEHTPEAALLGEAMTVLFCEIDDAYLHLNPDGHRYWADPVFCTRCYESVSTDSSSSGFPAFSTLPSRSAAAANSAGVW